MKIKDLLVTNVNITEDDYDYKGFCTLVHGKASKTCDIAEIESGKCIGEIKSFFELDDSPEEIRSTLMDTIMQMVTLSSSITEGEQYNVKSGEVKIEKSSNEFDMA